MTESHSEILRKLAMLEKKDLELDDKETLILEYLKQIELPAVSGGELTPKEIRR